MSKNSVGFKILMSKDMAYIQQPDPAYSMSNKLYGQDFAKRGRHLRMKLSLKTNFFRQTGKIKFLDYVDLNKCDKPKKKCEKIF